MQQGSGMPPKRGMSPWAWVGIGCGGCGLIGLIALVALGFFAGGAIRGVLDEVNTPTAPPPKAYVGLWSGPGNQTLFIGADGRGSWNESSGNGSFKSNLKVDGGRVTVDEKGKLLSVTLAGYGKKLRLDKPPKESETPRTMVLDGQTFRYGGPWKFNTGEPEPGPPPKAGR